MQENPNSSSLRETRSMKVAMLYSFKLAWLPTLTLVLTSYYRICTSTVYVILFTSHRSLLSLSPSHILSTSLILPCKHLHVSVTFSLKILLSIFCSSQITSTKDKNSIIKPLLKESRSRNICFSLSGSCQLFNLG